MSNLFSLYWNDIDGNQVTEFKYKPLSQVKEAIDRLTLGPGRLCVKEIKVVDVLDRLCFHSIGGVPQDENGNPMPPRKEQP
jgi:hypothetical protein|tara:strand:- start:1453 stop:1695 length:243 start_codon:yes stop_codon:yes gene_type:complete